MEFDLSTAKNPSAITIDFDKLTASQTIASKIKGKEAIEPTKVYAEFTYTGTRNTVFGFVKLDTDLNTLGGSILNANGVGRSCAFYINSSTDRFYNGGSSYIHLGVTSSVGDVIMLAFDTSTGKAWVGYNGVWNNSGNPSAGTGALTSSLPFLTGDDWTIVAELNTQGDSITTAMAESPQGFTYDPPSGFSPIQSRIINLITGNVLDSKGLPTVSQITANNVVTGDRIDSQFSDAETGAYSLNVNETNVVLTCFPTEPLNPICRVFDYNLTTIQNFNFSSNNLSPIGGTNSSIVSGNVKKLGVAYSADVVITSAYSPTVLGVTRTNPETGDYSYDISPHEGLVMVYVAPDYGSKYFANKTVTANQIIHPTIPNGYIYTCQSAGTLGASEPTWLNDTPTVSGNVLLDPSILHRPLMNGFIQPVVAPYPTRTHNGRTLNDKLTVKINGEDYIRSIDQGDNDYVAYFKVSDNSQLKLTSGMSALVNNGDFANSTFDYWYLPPSGNDGATYIDERTRESVAKKIVRSNNSTKHEIIQFFNIDDFIVNLGYPKDSKKSLLDSVSESVNFGVSIVQTSFDGSDKVLFELEIKNNTNDRMGLVTSTSIATDPTLWTTRTEQVGVLANQETIDMFIVKVRGDRFAGVNNDGYVTDIKIVVI